MWQRKCNNFASMEFRARIVLRASSALWRMFRPGLKHLQSGSAHLSILFAGLILPASAADIFKLPTANDAIYEVGEQEKMFVATPGKTWISGTFGCVRTDGWQLHEGLDIKCLKRDKHGEPTDPVMATADGTVVYINQHPSLSNYGNYIILRHQVDGMEICSLYAHLHEVRAGLAIGNSVKAGETIAIMGRTSNTRQRIALDRAHVHFELDFVLNERYAAWHKSAIPGERNDHGDWNGKNLLGIDPRAILLAQHNARAFSLRQFLTTQTELCRVLVRDTHFSWLRRYPMLVRSNPLAEKEGIVAYELALTFNGIPFQLTPRAASEIKTKDRFHLLSVNQREQQDNPCGRLVTQQRGRWQLTSHGVELLQLLTY